MSSTLRTTPAEIDTRAAAKRALYPKVAAQVDWHMQISDGHLETQPSSPETRRDPLLQNLTNLAIGL